MMKTIIIICIISLLVFTLSTMQGVGEKDASEGFTMPTTQSLYNSNMRYIRHNAPSIFTRITKYIMSRVRAFIPGLN